MKQMTSVDPDKLTSADLDAINSLPAVRRGPVVDLIRRIVKAGGKTRPPRAKVTRPQAASTDSERPPRTVAPDAAAWFSVR
jgi:hypothetical protein